MNNCANLGWEASATVLVVGFTFGIQIEMIRLQQ